MYIWTLWDGDGERETHTHTYIHPSMHACMHAYIYIILRRILYMYLSIYLSINPFIYLPFDLHMFHVSTCTLSAHRGSCRAWWISTTACAPGRTQSPSDTLLGARATWTATSHLAMCSRGGCRWNSCWDGYGGSKQCWGPCQEEDEEVSSKFCSWIAFWPQCCS